jgi:plasmid maintenance system killer protein
MPARAVDRCPGSPPSRCISTRAGDKSWHRLTLRHRGVAGDRKGQHSIRINDQFCVCFVWTAEDAADVEIVDYH